MDQAERRTYLIEALLRERPAAGRRSRGRRSGRRSCCAD